MRSKWSIAVLASLLVLTIPNVASASGWNNNHNQGGGRTHQWSGGAGIGKGVTPGLLGGAGSGHYTIPTPPPPKPKPVRVCYPPSVTISMVHGYTPGHYTTQPVWVQPAPLAIWHPGRTAYRTVSVTTPGYWTKTTKQVAEQVPVQVQQAYSVQVPEPVTVNGPYVTWAAVTQPAVTKQEPVALTSSTSPAANLPSNDFGGGGYVTVTVQPSQTQYKPVTVYGPHTVTQMVSQTRYRTVTQLQTQQVSVTVPEWVPPTTTKRTVAYKVAGYYTYQSRPGYWSAKQVWVPGHAYQYQQIVNHPGYCVTQ